MTYYLRNAVQSFVYGHYNDFQYWARRSVIKDILLDVSLTANQKLRLLCAEAIKTAAIAVLEKWFQGIESGQASLWFPAPGCVVSQEEADKFVEDIDDGISSELESTNLHWVSQGIDLSPEFCRLAPAQRIAMLEEYRKVVIEEIKKIHSSIFIDCLHACPTEIEEKLREVFAEGIKTIDRW